MASTRPADRGRSRLGPPASRWVVLGASNVRMALPLILDEALRRQPRPADVFVACGHGRSYGVESAIPGRTLPGIAECGLWRAAAEEPGLVFPGDRAEPPPTRAIVADVGNDLMYGLPPERIAGFVEACLTRLAGLAARSVIVGLPLCNTTEGVGWKFRFLRTVLFPGLTLTPAELIGRAEELDGRLRELAARFSAVHVTPVRGWYGFDPIHIHRARWREVWRAIAAQTDVRAAGGTPAIPQPPYPPPTAPVGPGLTLGEWLTVKRRPVEAKRLFGVARTAAQPALTLRDGTRVSLF